MTPEETQAAFSRLAEQVQELSDRVQHAGYTQPVLNDGEPRMLIVDSLDGLDAASRRYFDVAVKGSPDITYKSLRDPDGTWSWRLLSTGRFPFAEQGRDEGLAFGVTFGPDSPGFTQSVTEFETILDTGTMSNPITPEAFALFTMNLFVAPIPTAGTGQKQIRIVFNDTTIGDVDLGTVTAGFFAMFVIGPMPYWAERSVEGVNATWNSIAFSTTVEDIERIRIQARTQDEQDGNDLVYGANLIVYA